MATAFVRGAVLLAAIVLALLYLDSAAYSAWAGGGPPTTFREAWMQRAVTHLCYAVAAALGGFALFSFIRQPLRLGRATVVWLALALFLIAAPHVRRVLLMDRCLDGDGRWDDAAFRCEK